MQHTTQCVKTSSIIAIACVALLFTQACGNYSYNWKRISYTEYNKPKERTLGVVSIYDTFDNEGIDLHLTKKRGGYGIETPLYQSDFSNVNAVVSKSKDYDYFTGIQMRLRF